MQNKNIYDLLRWANNDKGSEQSEDASKEIERRIKLKESK